jgi:hypothetical protein
LSKAKLGFCRPAVWYLGCSSFSNKRNRSFDPPTHSSKLDIRATQSYMGAAWNWTFVMGIISSPGQLTPGPAPWSFNRLHTLRNRRKCSQPPPFFPFPFPLPWTSPKVGYQFCQIHVESDRLPMARSRALIVFVHSISGTSQSPNTRNSGTPALIHCISLFIMGIGC